jgi:hypothetical protein
LGQSTDYEALMVIWLATTLAIAGPTVELDLSAPWVVAAQTDTAVTLRLGDTAEGLWIGLAHSDGRIPGVSPVWRGRTLRTGEGDSSWPMVAPAWPDLPLTRVVIETRGPDLVVRMFGPPLTDVTTHPDAPEDPVHTWVRVRPRTKDWRLVVTGMATITVPAHRVALAANGTVADGEWGALAWHTDAPATWSSWLDGVLTVGTGPSVHLAQPYPRTSATWFTP